MEWKLCKSSRLGVFRNKAVSKNISKYVSKYNFAKMGFHLRYFVYITLKVFHTFASVSIVDFEQVIVCLLFLLTLFVTILYSNPFIQHAVRTTLQKRIFF